MNRYIDADAMKNDLDTIQTSYPVCKSIKKAIKEYIDMQPSVDVVEVVRCKDCKFNKGHNKCLNEHSIIDIPKDNDYCSYGEKK